MYFQIYCVLKLCPQPMTSTSVLKQCPKPMSSFDVLNQCPHQMASISVHILCHQLVSSNSVPNHAVASTKVFKNCFQRAFKPVQCLLQQYSQSVPSTNAPGVISLARVLSGLDKQQEPTKWKEIQLCNNVIIIDKLRSHFLTILPQHSK